MEIHLKIIGTLLIALALIHIGFPRYFKWEQELSSLSIMNRQMMHIHSFFIAFVVFLMGVLCVSSSEELFHSDFGKRISLGLGIFWTVRLLIQFFGYSSKLWRGKSFETSIHILFSLFWIYLSCVFLMIAVR
jgi:hypothetical protein